MTWLIYHDGTNIIIHLPFIYLSVHIFLAVGLPETRADTGWSGVGFVFCQLKFCATTRHLTILSRV